MNKTPLIGFLILVVSGCASAPIASLHPRPIQLVPVNALTPDESLRLVLPDGSAEASGALVGNIVYVHVRFTNISKVPVDFGPGLISLTGPDNTLLRALSPTDVVDTYGAVAAGLRANAQQAARAAREARRSQMENQRIVDEGGVQNADGSRNGTLAALAATSVALGTIGTIGQESEAIRLRDLANASQAETQAIAEKILSSSLQPTRVPPGVTTDGWVYFDEPPQWPVTLRILANDHMASASLMMLAENTAAPTADRP